MRVLTLAIACFVVAGAAGSAAADPISLAIGVQAVFGSAALFTSAAAVTAFTTAASIVGGAALIAGATFATQALTAQPQTGSGAIKQQPRLNSPEQKISTRQSAPPKRIPYGTVHMGGALFFEQVKPPYLYRGFLLSAREIEGIEKIYIGTTEIPFRAMTPGVVLTPQQQATGPAYHNRLQVSIRLGSEDQTIDPLLARDFPNLDASFRQRGIATVVVRYHYGSDWDEHQSLWGVAGEPQTWFLVKGVKVYDPRDPTQQRDVPSTWKWSSNATLCQTDFLRAQYGGRISADRIDWDKTIASAAFDDETVGTKEGRFIRRYTCDGMITLNTSPAEIMQSMLTANRGTIVQSGGRMWVASSKPAARCLTIHDDLITGAVEYRNDKPKRDLVNTVQTRFIADQREYNLTDGPILVDQAALTADGEPLVATLELSFTRDHRRVQRLQKAYLGTSRLGRTLALPVDIAALAEASDEIVNGHVLMDSRLFPQANGIYRPHTLSFADNFSSISLEMSEYDPAVETAWNYETDEQDFTVAELNVS